MPKEYVPIGQHKPNSDGKICRCGSKTHMQASSHMCPLNKRWEGDVSRFQVGIELCACSITFITHTLTLTLTVVRAAAFLALLGLR